MKEKTKSKKLLIGIIAAFVLIAIVFAVVCLLAKKNGEGVIEYLKREVYEAKLEDLGDPNNDVGVRILDCDSMDSLKEAQNVKVTTRSGRYLQGKGAYTNMKYQTDLLRGIIKQPVNISKYAEGSIHISLYVAKKSALNDMIHFELSSMATPDADELEWFIPISKLEDGWNEFYLAIPGAMETGKLDLTSVNFFRVFSPNPQKGVSIVLDDVYASDKEGVIFEPESSALKPVTPDSYKETEAVDGKMIMSCNTVNIFELLGNVEVTVTKGEFVEGTGAFKTVGFQSSLGEGVFAKPVNISKYENGSVHVSLFVNDKSLIKKELFFELTSGGTCDVDEYNWNIPVSQLKNGWNELMLPIHSAMVTGKPDLSKINYFRFFTLDQQEGLVTIFDNVYATNKGTEDGYKETTSPYGKMIASCNTVNIFRTLTNMEVTTAQNEFVEGTGAFKTVGTEDVLGAGELKKAVDISEYADGHVHISLYVNDVSKIKETVNFELSSAGKWDVDEYEWTIPKSALKNGWNDLYLSFADAFKTGSPNLKAINFFRMYTVGRNAALVTILDNVYATKQAGDGSVETESKYGKMIISGNTTSNFRAFANMAVTSVGREYVEGTGALKAVGTVDSLGEAVFKTPVDVSAYKNGYVHVSLYVNDVTLLKNTVNLELSSSGACDVNEYEWILETSSLKNGWNELYLAFNDALKTGNPNLGAINFFRMFTVDRDANLVTIFDDMYATNDKNSGDRTACGERLYAGDIMMSDCTCYFTNAFNMKLSSDCQQGSYALKAKNPAVGIYGTFKTAVDISNYKDGYIHLWVYINNKNNLTTNMNFELSSSGTCNVNEYEWVINKKDLNSGWNELYLPIKDAFVTGTPNLSAINYFRMFTTNPNDNLEWMIDDVYATTK